MGYKKLALSFLAIAVAMVAVLVLSFLYLYYHPSTLKTVIEKSFSAKADLSLKIEDLGYSIRPLGVLAKNIVIKAAKNAYRFELKVPQLKADFSLAGPFGSRKLIIKELSLTEFSIDLEPGLNLPQLTEQKKSTSAFGRILKRLVGFFFFTDVMVESAQARNGRMHLQSADQQILVRQLNASLTADRLDISGSAAIHWLASDSIVKFPEFSIAVDSGFYTGKSIIGGQILFPEGIFEGPNARVEGIQGDLRWVYKPALKKIEIESATVEGKSLIIAGKMGTATVFNNLLFTTGGIHDLHQNQLRLTDWRLTTENLFELNGNAEVNIQPPYSLKIGFTHGRLASQRLLPIFKDVFNLNSIPLTLSGDIGLEGTIDVTQTRPEWAFHTDITAKLAQNQVSISSDRIRLNGIFSGHIRAVGRMPSPDLSAAFNGENIILASGDTKLRSITVNVSMNGSYPAFSIPDLKARIPRMGSKDHSLDNIEVHLKNGLVNVKTGSLSWPEIRLSSSVLKNLRLSASGQSEQLLINLNAEDSHLLEAAATFGFLPEDWTFGGRDSIQATAVIRQNGWSTISSKLAITGLNFYNPDESCLAENIRASLETSTMFHMEDRKIKGTFSFETPNGEFLCDKIYLDLAQNGFSATADGIYDGQSRSLQISRIKLGLQDLVALDIHGNLYSRNNTPEFDFFIALPKTAISPLFYHLIAEPFKHERPALAELKIDGLISAGLNVVKKGTDWTVKGKANWHTGNLNVGKTGVFLKGIDMNLPVWFQTEKPQSGSETMRGRLLIQKMALPFLPEQPLTIPLKVRPDSIATAAATRLFFESGDILFDPVVVKNIYTMRPSMETNLSVNSIMLDPLLTGIWPNPTHGVMQGKLDRIIFDGNNLTSHGTITADIFGGQVLISNPGVLGLSTAAPGFTLNVSIDDLKLAELTEGTAFGKIQGVLTGYITNLDIVNGQPQKFDLLLKTRRKKDVPQKINVRAIENIAQLGGGQSPFMGLAGTFVSFFKEFSYQKIGVAASLENDVFKVNGTIKKNGVEYLVKKGGLTGVDVVNLNPDSRISFKDMVKRIKRIKGAREKPVIH